MRRLLATLQQTRRGLAAAEMIRDLGLTVLADKILERFQNAERLAKIKRAVDRILTLFPFEEPIYREAGVDVAFVDAEATDAVWRSESSWILETQVSEPLPSAIHSC